MAAVEALDPDRIGSDLETLRVYTVENAGVEAHALAVPADKVAGVKGEAILHMSQKHDVMRLAATDHSVLVFDPGMGPVFYAQADFAALYSGHKLQVPRRAGRSSTLPAARGGIACGAAGGLVGGNGRDRWEPRALFLMGVTSRLAEIGLLLCQRLLAEPELVPSREGRDLRIDGIERLTMTLQQPDLTVREQRLILADIVRRALDGLPEDYRPRLGPVRIFGPGQDATQADFEYLMIAREARTGTTLPVPGGRFGSTE